MLRYFTHHCNYYNGIEHQRKSVVLTHTLLDHLDVMTDT